MSVANSVSNADNIFLFYDKDDSSVVIPSHLINVLKSQTLTMVEIDSTEEEVSHQGSYKHPSKSTGDLGSFDNPESMKSVFKKRGKDFKIGLEDLEKETIFVSLSKELDISVYSNGIFKTFCKENGLKTEDIVNTKFAKSVQGQTIIDQYIYDHSNKKLIWVKDNVTGSHIETKIDIGEVNYKKSDDLAENLVTNSLLNRDDFKIIHVSPVESDPEKQFLPSTDYLLGQKSIDADFECSELERETLKVEEGNLLEMSDIEALIKLRNKPAKRKREEDEKEEDDPKKKGKGPDAGESKEKDSGDTTGKSGDSEEGEKASGSSAESATGESKKDSSSSDPDIADLFSLDNAGNLLEFVSHVEPRIKYEGFDSEVIREEFRKSEPDRKRLAKKLVICLMAYAEIGNNVSKLQENRVDKVVSNKLLSVVESFNIKVRRTDKTTLTLPRIALAFMPEYLIFRKFMAKNLTSQTSSTINVVYQDQAFAGCGQISGMTGYDIYNKEFSSLIYQKEKGVALDDKTFLATLDKWKKIATAGYNSDKRNVNMMNAVLSLASASPYKAHAIILESIMKEE